jgi:hypothetical protein
MQCILGDEEFSIVLKQSTMKNKLINHALSLCEQFVLLAIQTTTSIAHLNELLVYFN